LAKLTSGNMAEFKDLVDKTCLYRCVCS